MKDILLAVEELHTYFRVSRGMVKAVDGTSLTLARGETLGLVGESGCGKSTLGKSIARLVPVTSGRILFDGTDISQLSRRGLQPFRKRMQFVFQDPYASLNPRSSVRRILMEPLEVHGTGSRAERQCRIDSMLERVGISAEATGKYPHEFSGGQRQRIGIARALMLEPELLVCDEPVSALDVSVQAQVLNLLSDLQRDMGFSSLFITHDFSVVKYISDRIAVMYLGKIVEIATPQSIWNTPRHPYTQMLISAVPMPPTGQAERENRPLPIGEIPSQVNPPSGCGFHPRCPRADNFCAEVTPVLTACETSDGQPAFVACHLAGN